MKNRNNPFVRQKDQVIPIGHHADQINAVTIATDDVLKNLLEALDVEREQALRKVIILKLLELLKTEKLLLPDELPLIAFSLGVVVRKTDINEVLEWQLPY